MQYIRPWTMADAADIATAINNTRITDNLRDGIPSPYGLSDARTYIQSVLDAPADSQFCWAIAFEGRAVGSIGIFRKDNIHRRTAELGYYLAEACWGKGLMTNAVREACAYVFENTDIVRIFAEPFSSNGASRRVLEKAGFVREGTLAKNAEKNGEIIDMEMYALVK